MGDFWHDVAEDFQDETGRKVRAMDIARKFSGQDPHNSNSSKHSKQNKSKEAKAYEDSLSSSEEW